ncbi:RnfABCDGE type electron transport complex subunit D [Desulfonatronum thioautotrophicum]|uniref:RnfABCDGE type electron transport complex subunit D n=1 Tax=Desulfonatronum thioautotrophicum TaxID=617001 RepID=UPI0005EB3F73|nr:RnfABCDGE type electron transport complex subunit D [Desulfonatronum thioautotrophicum]
MKLPPIQKQKIMVKVLYALLPVIVTATYFFGLRVLAVVAVAMAFAFLTEWFMASRRGGKVTQACFVTGALYALALPPNTPFWITAVGIVVGILFGKELFGGFGKNVFNPAIVGRAFVWLSFPLELTNQFVPVFRDFPGGLVHWSMATAEKLPEYLYQASREIGHDVVDVMTSATPMVARKAFDYEIGAMDLFLGSIGGFFQYGEQTLLLGAGSMGEVSAAAILVGAIYLLYTKTAQWRLMLPPIIGASALCLFLRYGLGVDAVPPLEFTLFSGALLYAAVFMVTEPVSAPKLPASQWIYGLFIGMMIVFFRAYGIFAGAVAFSILLGNMLAPSLDLWIKRFSAPPAKPQTASGGGKS